MELSERGESMWKAAMSGKDERLGFLLEQGGWTQYDLDGCLGLAVGMGSILSRAKTAEEAKERSRAAVAMIDMLDALGAKPDDGVLHQATRGDSEEVLERVLRLEGLALHDLSTRSSEGPMFDVAGGPGSKRMMEMLIARGLPMDRLDRDGRTPMHYAVRKGNQGAFEALVEAGARLDIKDRAGLDPFQLGLSHSRFNQERCERWRGWANALAEARALESAARAPKKSKSAQRI